MALFTRNIETHLPHLLAHLHLYNTIHQTANYPPNYRLQHQRSREYTPPTPQPSTNPLIPKPSLPFPPQPQHHSKTQHHLPLLRRPPNPHKSALRPPPRHPRPPRHRRRPGAPNPRTAPKRRRDPRRLYAFSENIRRTRGPGLFRGTAVRYLGGGGAGYL